MRRQMKIYMTEARREMRPKREATTLETSNRYLNERGGQRIDRMSN